MSAPGTAVVTGAAGAIGRAITQRLSEDGWRVLLVDVVPLEDAAAALREAGASVSTCVADLGTAAGVEQVGAAASAAGDVALLVNNAGITRDGRAAAMQEAHFREVISVNLVAPLRLSERLASQLRGGAIVNMASRAAFGNFGQANYVAAKSGLLGATRSLALRLAPHTRVNAVAPGLIATPMTAAMPPDVLEKLVARVPEGRIGTTAEVAEAVAFLARAPYVTGQVLAVCGGRSLGDSV